MRPAVLWFDETYNQELYQVETAGEVLESDVDALIVVGTALATAMANRIVNRCLSRDILIIDVNIEPACTAGHTVQVMEKSETSLPKLFKSYKSDGSFEEVKLPKKSLDSKATRTSKPSKAAKTPSQKNSAKVVKSGKASNPSKPGKKILSQKSRKISK